MREHGDELVGQLEPIHVLDEAGCAFDLLKRDRVLRKFSLCVARYGMVLAYLCGLRCVDRGHEFAPLGAVDGPVYPEAILRSGGAVLCALEMGFLDLVEARARIGGRGAVQVNEMRAALVKRRGRLRTLNAEALPLTASPTMISG